MAFKKFRQWPSSASLALIPSLVRFLKEETITKSERANLTRCSRASVRGFSHSWLSFEFIDEGPSMRLGGFSLSLDPDDATELLVILISLSLDALSVARTVSSLIVFSILSPIHIT